MECKCYIKEDAGVEPQLIKCSLCKSASELYEACKAILADRNSALARDKGRKALSKAEGK